MTTTYTSGAVRRLCVGLSVTVAAVMSSGCASAPRAEAQVPAQPTAAAAPGIEDRTAEEAMERGDGAFRASDIERALFHYSQAAQLDRAADLPLLRIAAIYESRSQASLARQALEQALLRAPANAAAHEHLGYALLSLGELDEADTHFAASTSVEASRWRSVAGRGLVAMRRNDLALARKQFDLALWLHPGSAELLAYSAEQHLRSGNLVAGLRDARASLEKAPSPSTQLVLGDLLARSGDFAGGLEAYLVATDEPTAYQRLGEEAMRAAEYERAMRYFQQAASASPTFNEVAAKRMVVARERLAEARARKAATAGS